MPGMIDVYEYNTDTWTIETDTHFTFDDFNGIVYWNKTYKVDLINICDKCLHDVHFAASRIAP